MEQPGAFDALFFDHAARMVRRARPLGDDDPEDVVQESFCKLYAARERLLHDERKGAGLPAPDRRQRGARTPRQL